MLLSRWPCRERRGEQLRKCLSEPERTKSPWVDPLKCGQSQSQWILKSYTAIWNRPKVCL
jgi:hypothetical protein